MTLKTMVRSVPGLLLAAIVALAIGLRVRQAAGSMVYDEMASMYFSGQSWGNLWGWWMLRETNPPLFYSLLKLWRMVVPSPGEWAIRLLPLMIGFAHLAVFGHYVRRRLGWPAALLGLLLFALSPADIYQSAYVRGYVLAKLMVLVSFIGLVRAIEADGDRKAARSGWAAYVLAAVVAIYCHTTMVLWPVIVTIAVLVDEGLSRRLRMGLALRLIGADLGIMVLSGWVIVIALAQLHARSANIAWLVPLNWIDYQSSLNLQLLTGGAFSALLMAGLMLIGLIRRFRSRIVRLAALISLLTVVLFKLADQVHPIISDYTMHWCANFTVLLAAASLTGGVIGEDPARRFLRQVSALSVLGGVALAGLVDLFVVDYMVVPQDWRATVHTVADHPGAALLVSHESIGVVIEQTCLVEFGSEHCPFPLVVMSDPRQTDNWAFGGYHGRLVRPEDVRAALGKASTIYAFSRYYYTPLQHLGLDPGDWNEVMWDDGELIGPIPATAFDPPGPGEPPRKADYNAQYTGQIDDDDDSADDGDGGD